MAKALKTAATVVGIVATAVALAPLLGPGAAAVAGLGLELADLSNPARFDIDSDSARLIEAQRQQTVGRMAERGPRVCGSAPHRRLGRSSGGDASRRRRATHHGMAAGSPGRADNGLNAGPPRHPVPDRGSAASRSPDPLGGQNAGSARRLRERWQPGSEHRVCGRSGATRLMWASDPGLKEVAWHPESLHAGCGFSGRHPSSAVPWKSGQRTRGS